MPITAAVPVFAGLHKHADFWVEANSNLNTRKSSEEIVLFVSFIESMYIW